MDGTLTVLHNFTLRQMVIAAGTARGLDRNRCIQLANCSVNSYHKVLKTDGFNELVIALKSMPVDPDNREFKGIGTLFVDIARLLYSVGEKNNINLDKDK
jgi:hypothetical protein